MLELSIRSQVKRPGVEKIKSRDAAAADAEAVTRGAAEGGEGRGVNGREGEEEEEEEGPDDDDFEDFFDATEVGKLWRLRALES